MTDTGTGNARTLTSLSLREADLARLDAMAKLLGCSRTEAMRQSAPSEDVLKIFGALCADNPGLSYTFFVDSCVRSWLVSVAPKVSRADMLTNLKSKVRSDREVAAKLMALSIGAGLHIQTDKIAELLDRAVEGDKKAVRVLEEKITSQVPTNPATGEEVTSG